MRGESCTHRRDLVRSRVMAALASHQPANPNTQWYVTRTIVECDLDELLDVVADCLDTLR